jgi:SAM-dependent methyltransferase
MTRSAEHWEAEAQHWAAWARAPEHDAYWYYRDAFFALVPPAGRGTLEIGFGEGRVSRDLVARGHHVSGVDVSPTLARLAREADPKSRYVLADGAMLPFAAGAFDLVVAYNSLMDVDDMPAVCAEIARVLDPRGRLCVCVQHPVWDAGKFVGAGPEATFVGWSFSIDDYARAFEAASFVIESLREPRPGPTAPPTTRGHRLPIFLMLRLRKA